MPLPSQSFAQPLRLTTLAIEIAAIATAGVAFTQVSAEADVFNGFANLSADKNFTGWTVGADAEYAFTNNWIGLLEYRFYDFGNTSLDGFGDVEIQTNTLTAGVSYKF